MAIAENLLLERAAADEVARLGRYRKAWDAYYGHFKKPLAVRSGKADDNVIVNFARLVVDKSVSFLFGRDVQFELQAGQETPAEAWLAKCWRANRQMTTLQKLATNGAVCGHTFVKIVPGQPYPRVVVLDPATVSVRWHPDDIEVVERYTVEYPALDLQGKPIVIRQVIERAGAAWRVTDQVSRAGTGAWQTTGGTPWPYAWPPIVDAQNLPAPNEYFGISDLEEDLLQLNGALNFVLSNLARIIRFHAHPKTVGEGMAATQLSVGADETICIPPGSKLYNLEMQSDLASSIALYQRLREALHETSRIPEVAVGKLESAGNLSGVALQILYQPLLELTETKRRTYGDLLVEMNRRLLELAGFGPDNHVAIHWPQLLPSDPLQERQALLLDKEMGASRDTLLTKLGYDPEFEARKREADSNQLGSQLLGAFDQGR